MSICRVMGVILPDGRRWNGDGTIATHEPATVGYEYDLTIDAELTGKDAEDGQLSDITLTLNGIEASQLSGLSIGGEPVSFEVNADGTITITLPENTGTSVSIKGKVTTAVDEGDWSLTARAESLYDGESVYKAVSNVLPKDRKS